MTSLFVFQLNIYCAILTCPITLPYLRACLVTKH